MVGPHKKLLSHWTWSKLALFLFQKSGAADEDEDAYKGDNEESGFEDNGSATADDDTDELPDIIKPDDVTKNDESSENDVSADVENDDSADVEKEEGEEKEEEETNDVEEAKPEEESKKLISQPNTACISYLKLFKA